MQSSEVQSRRKTMGLTQDQLARLLKVTVNTVARWEQGKATPPAYLRMALQWLDDDLVAGRQKRPE